jgi:hypothetical protein
MSGQMSEPRTIRRGSNIEACRSRSAFSDQ